jgi:quercetin dioxygenase-like cupin family protein
MVDNDINNMFKNFPPRKPESKYWEIHLEGGLRPNSSGPPLSNHTKERSIMTTLEMTNLDNAPAYWFLNALHLLLAHNESGDGTYSLIHLTAPPDLETPYHLHHTEDEAFYVLEGELAVVCGGQTIVAGPGSYVFLPRGVPHGFRNIANKDSQVLIHAIPGNKVGFVGMMLEMATPIHDRQKLPEGTPVDLKKLSSLCEQNNISVLGPLPI